jgi:hypothetical protein
MPEPHKGRNKLLKYLRYEFPHSKSFIDPGSGETFTKIQIKEAIKKLIKTDPGHHRILYYWYNSRMSRLQIAAAAEMDSSTVKRKMDASADIILMHLLHSDLLPEEPLDLCPWEDDDE